MGQRNSLGTLFALLCICSLLVSYSWATEPTVTLSVYAKPIGQVITRLGRNVKLAPDVDPETVVSFSVEKVPITEALVKILRPVGLTYALDGKGFLIVRQPMVTLTEYSQPLGLVLDSLFTGSTFSWVLKDGADENTLVSANFTNVGVETALERLTGQSGYFWKREGNSYIVFRDKEESFFVNYPAMSQYFRVSSSRAGTTSTSTSGTPGVSPGMAAPGTGGYGAVPGTTGGVPGTAGGLSANSSTAMATGDSSSMDSLTKALKEMLTKDGKVAVHKEAGMIWVRDRADAVDRAGAFIKELNGKLNRSVKIQGIITEIELTDGREMGVDWNVVAGSLAGAIQSASKVSDSLLTLRFTWNQRAEQTLLSALETYGNVHVVSRPSLMVQNGALGSLTVGDTVSYIAQAYSSTSTVALTTAALIVQSVQTGLSFYVLPKIIDDDSAILYVTPDLTTLQEIRTISTKDGNLTVEAPRLTTKQAQTVVRVKNGESVIIGGLMSQDDQKNSKGVPLLKDVPLLGSLFKYDNTSKKKTEFALMFEVKW